MTLTSNSWPDGYYDGTRVPDDLEEYDLKYGNSYPTRSARRSLMRHDYKLLNKPKHPTILTLMRKPA